MLYQTRKIYLIICISICTALYGYAQKVTFRADFAPTAPTVAASEADFRSAISLNGSWQFKPVKNAEMLKKEEIKNPFYPSKTNWESIPVKVPSPWNVNNFATEDIQGGDFITYPSYPRRWEKVKAGWLMRKLDYRKEWRNKRLILHFDGVGGFTQVYLNKKKIAENFDVFLPFEVDITGKLEAGRENELSLWVADGRLLDEPGRLGRRVFVAGSFWGQHVRGIWQDVELLVKPEVYISETFVQPLVDRDTLAVTLTIRNTTGKVKNISIDGSILPWINQAGSLPVEAPEVRSKLGNKVARLQINGVSLPANGTKTVTLRIKVNGRMKLWSTEAPHLYAVIIEPRENGTALDKKYTRFGWRQFTVAGTKINLNGKPIVFKGDSWHFMGIPQMTRRYAWAWFQTLKDANANAVRLHAQPYPAFYLDMADEMGICVLDETGMWASDGGPKVDGEEYWRRSEDHLKRFILRDRNHPAVFGWSICNENLAVTIGVLHAPEPIVKRQINEINKWVAITRQLDPTRNWISGDGETNEPTDLPTVIGHYGDENAYKDWSSQGKPWGIGESGMAYYGTPKQTSAYNGEQSYRSQHGRMEGVAYEATKLLNQQKTYNASYRSIFNLVWYGLQPLELGLADTTRRPTASDGIFFGKYVEGKAGVQPERLGPYTTTLNPGYDPALPMYRTWPLFTAVKDGFGDSPQVAAPPLPAERPKNKIFASQNSLILISADPDTTLGRMFNEMGYMVNKSGDNTGGMLLVIDGLYPPSTQQAMAMKDRVLKNGGKVLIWGLSEQSKPIVNSYLTHPISLTQRSSTSFLITAANVIMGDLSDADFYFTELSDKPISSHGISGSFTNGEEILLKASNTDWGKWNKQAEYLKTAAVLRSERESKPQGNAMIYMPQAEGGLYLTSLDASALYKASPMLISSILGNLGVSTDISLPTKKNNLGSDGFIEKALFAGSFNNRGDQNNKYKYRDFLAGADSTRFVPGGGIAGNIWKLIPAGNDHSLSPIGQLGDNNSVSYYSFWIYSPRSLSNLLLEPDMPKIDMLAGSENDISLYLNGRSIPGQPGDKKVSKFSALPFEKGWNLVRVKAVKKSNDWKISIRLVSDNTSFLKKEIKGEAYR